MESGLGSLPPGSRLYPSHTLSLKELSSDFWLSSWVEGGAFAEIKKVGGGGGEQGGHNLSAYFHNYAVAKGSQLQPFLYENKISL